MAINGVLFDWDGTLTEGTNELWLQSNNETVRLYGSNDMTMDTFAGLGFGTDIHRMLLHLGIDVGKGKEIDLHRNALYNALLAKNAAWMSGGPELVEAVRSAGRRTGVVTHARRPNILVQDERLKWMPLMDVVVTKDDMETDEGNYYKPDPFSLRLAAQKLGIPLDECCYVGDLKSDMEAGVNAGIPGVLVVGSLTTEAAMQIATHVYHSLKECRERIQEWMMK
jgi:beta-phosphoglucomutase-like phosphatase (HAD superfamily)